MERNKNIDNLRGLAMLAMIVIHATSYFLRDKTAFYIWDLSEWSVVTFLFCSAFLFFNKKFSLDIKSTVNYFKKRIFRLYPTYFFFLLFYFPLAFHFEKQKMNPSYILQNIFFIGGLDLNWLVLIFFEFMIVFPIVYFFKTKNKFLYYAYLGLSFASSIYYLFVRDWNYRFIMWLPWSLVVYFTIYFIDNIKKYKKLVSLFILSTLAFVATWLLLSKLGHNLGQYENKYPPNLYHLTYGIFSTMILYWLSVKNVFGFLKFDRFLNFLSVNSYPLFFIHNLVIFVLTWERIQFTNWIQFFLAISAISFLAQIILIQLLSRMTGQKPARKIAS